MNTYRVRHDPLPASARGGRIVRVALCATLVALASGCGAIKMAYEDGETFTMFWVARYISLDKEQDALARPKVRAWLHWHRTTQLPDYAHLAVELQRRVEGPVSATDMDQIEAELRARWHHMADQAVPELADLALSIRPEQLGRIEQKFAANDDTYRSDFVDVSSARRKKDLYNKQLDRVEYWYGSLSAQQKDLLRTTTDALPIDPTLWLAERQAREAEFIALLRRIATDKPPRDVVVTLLRAYAARLETSPDPTRRTYLENLNRANRAMYMTIANMATTEQRTHAVEKLGDWIEDFSKLAQG